jgi:hypothetical protein
METIIKIEQEIITIELANAIASFDIAKINELLSDDGEYCIQNDLLKQVNLCILKNF